MEPDRHKVYGVCTSKMMAGLFKNELTCTIQDGLSNGCSWHKADSDHRSYDYFLTSFVTCPKHVVVRYL